MNPLLIQWERNQVSTWTVARGSVVHVVEGALWLTGGCDPVDSVIEAGQSFRLRPGRWVVQSLAPTRYCVEVTASEEVSDGQAPLFPVLQRL